MPQGKSTGGADVQPTGVDKSGRLADSRGGGRITGLCSSRSRFCRLYRSLLAEVRLRRGEGGLLGQLPGFCYGGLFADLGQTLDGDVTAPAQTSTPCARPLDEQLREQPAAEPANEGADPFVARLPGLVRAQGFLAVQVQGQMGTLHVWIGIQLGQYFGGEGKVIADTLVEADPGSFFLVLKAGTLRARMGFLKGHGVSPVERGNTHPRWGDGGLPKG